MRCDILQILQKATRTHSNGVSPWRKTLLLIYLISPCSKYYNKSKQQTNKNKFPIAFCLALLWEEGGDVLCSSSQNNTNSMLKEVLKKTPCGFLGHKGFPTRFSFVLKLDKYQSQSTLHTCSEIGTERCYQKWSCYCLQQADFLDPTEPVPSVWIEMSNSIT